MKTIDDLAVAGRRVLVRADLNVPLDGDRITDDGRIRASLPTLTALLDRGARVVVCAHLGRPGGKQDLRYSLAPVGARLAELLDREVEFPGDIVGPAAHAAIAAISPTGWPRPSICTWRTASARCTGSTPASTMSRCACRARQATWCRPRWPR